MLSFGMQVRNSITPMPKGRPTTNPGDWRPVSVLPYPSKLIERVVNYQLVYHFECHNYLFCNQHGFRKGHSTSTAIFDYVQFLYDSYDSSMSSSSIFIDYSRAFDTIDYIILCKKLKLYGLDETSLKWFKSYLNEREQRVKVNDFVSDVKPVTMGVPQGSILGPFLFIAFINDLVSLLYDKHVNILLYADDTILYTAAPNVNLSVIKNQNAANRVQEWCHKNRLSINTKKTKHMIIHNRHKETICSGDEPVVNFDGHDLENVRMYNYLGVIVDDKLSFVDFVDQKHNKVNARLYQLKRLRPYITNDVACTIYKQTILPLMDYADFMIESTCPTVHNRLINLQEKALKYIDNEEHRNMRYDDLCTLYGIQPLKLRWREHILCLMYRQSKKKGKLDIKRTHINLRSNKKVKFKKIPMRNYEIFLRSPLYRCSKIWEMLKPEIQRATTKVKFKNYIRPMCRPNIV